MSTGGFVAFVTFGPGEANETVLSVDPGGSTNLFVAKYHSGGDLLWARAATGTFAAVGARRRRRRRRKHLHHGRLRVSRHSGG